MASVIRGSLDFYEYVFINATDPRVDTLGYPVAGNPLRFVPIVIVYTLMCIYGPKIMASRKAFDLKFAMIWYNFVQVAVNLLYVIWGTYNFTVNYKLDFSCQPVDYSTTGYGLFQLYFNYYYFCFKLLDLVDTVFIILKKKSNQLSLLHRYHHTVVLMATYMYLKYVAGGAGAYLGFLNSLVHVFMYFYYFLTAFKPELKTSIWWKKNITQLQIVQFLILVFLYGRTLLLHPDCSYPRGFLWFLTIQCTVMLLLFGEFYFRNYIKQRKLKN